MAMMTAMTTTTAIAEKRRGIDLRRLAFNRSSAPLEHGRYV
jgi:hypothetical protein